MGDFKLSVLLEGHEDDVRGVAFPAPDTVISASRDATVRLWKRISESPPRFDGSIASSASTFVNAVTFLPPSLEYPNGLILAGGKDTIIEARDPAKAPDVNAERLLVGHAHNVCSLDVSPDGKWAVSGSWDASARVWSVGKWDCAAVLEGHEASVWSVLAYDAETIITASADKLIRVFTPTGKLLRTIRGNTDVVRALCKLSNGHPSGADFASASNDGIIRLWQLNGRQVGELQGHESFIYALAALPNGELASSGEDRTVRIWRGSQCVQTITHPAISVWAVAVCSETGDLATGASDRIARIFSRSPERQADPAVIQAFEDSVKGSSIPQQQVGEVNKEKLPGPEFLTQKAGTKEGQVQMIKEENGRVTAHTWSSAAQQWINVGTVVDAVGSSGRKTDYFGKDYDYVFDVDIEDGKPPLKLPYNLSQNPYEAATKFIEDNELPIGYLDQVANFITTNTQGATIGQSSQAQSQPQAPSGADPWGQESRYRPGETLAATSDPPPSKQKSVLPQTDYLSIKTASLKTIQKKVEELNDQLLASGTKEGALNPHQVDITRKLTQELEKTSTSDASPNATLIEGTELIIQLISAWPPANRLPILDVLRLITASTSAAAGYKNGDGESLIEVLHHSGVCQDTDRPNNIMLSVRALANLFQTAKGRQLADDKFDAVHALVQPAARAIVNRNVTIAITTLYINFATLLTSASHHDLPSSSDRSFALLEDLASILQQEKDSEATYRALVAAGTLLALGEETRSAAKQVYDFESALQRAEAGVKEPRIKAVVNEIREMLSTV